jgi:DNA polymerase V
MNRTYALIDCNNFFVSCERLFRPQLSTTPVVVLSSNDGCVVSRSQEAKTLGIPMGAPHFKFREFFARHGVVAFSANFELYGNMSERITNLLCSITPQLEVYSVDESFLDLSELSIDDYQAWGHVVRASILRHVGIPVSVGIARTKTLAKVANNRAKIVPELGGSLDLSEQGSVTTRHLAGLPIQDVWGVGWRLAPKLRAEGVHNALALKNMNQRHAQQLMGIRGRQMVSELNGTACFPLQSVHKLQQTISRGRQFGEDTNDQYVIESAIASLTAQASAILRREQRLTKRASITIYTNRHKPGYQRIEHAMEFTTPSADTGYITGNLIRMVSDSFNPRLEYHKAEVVLYDFIEKNDIQTDILGAVQLETAQVGERKMEAVDALNLRHGKGTILFASEVLNQSWRPRRNLMSQRFTSAWGELPVVNLR